MAALFRTKLAQRICGCGFVQYVSKVLKIGFVFFGNNFRVMDLFLGTVDSREGPQGIDPRKSPGFPRPRGDGAGTGIGLQNYRGRGGDGEH